MREIIFKAKRIDTGEWVEGYLLRDGCTGQYFIHASGNSVNESDKVNEEGCLRFVAFEVDESTICQYTGLCDKNGRKIWENDIVRHEDLSSGRFVFGNQPMKNSYIKWNKAMVRFERSDWGNIYPSDSEVIGNYFDNPELLEKAR